VSIFDVDSRLQALAAATTALAAKKAYDAVAREPSNAGGITLSLSVGLSKARSTTAQTSSNAAGSTVSAGGDVSVSARGAGADSDITVRGSTITAGNNISLKAESDVNLLAARNTSELRSASSSISASLGVGLAAGKETGVTVDAGVAGSRGKANGDDLTWTNTRVDAGNILKLDSGSDTTLKGAVASGRAGRRQRRRQPQHREPAGHEPLYQQGDAEHGMRTGDWPIRFHIGAYVDFWFSHSHYELGRSCGRNQAAPPTRSAGSSHRATLASSEAVACPSAWRSSWLRSIIQCHP